MGAHLIFPERTYYIDPRLGNDAGDALTADTAIRSEVAMVTLWRQHGPGPIIIVCDDGFHDRATEERVRTALEKAGFVVPKYQDGE